MTPVTKCSKCGGTGKATLASGKNAGKKVECENCGGRGVIVTKQGQPGTD
jgi:DNA-directed RNA polymerase subunit RPC12/RpoP